MAYKVFLIRNQKSLIKAQPSRLLICLLVPIEVASFILSVAQEIGNHDEAQSRLEPQQNGLDPGARMPQGIYPCLVCTNCKKAYELQSFVVYGGTYLGVYKTDKGKGQREHH